ncbi:hypothetical protein KC19_8G010500 [Ceratodon purpureus]|uniref:Uncharacterized protein n=1 Tax=Ceratodon purpureus TaxID=3225 RepID=A0A8T0GWB3_CERPU|nr:hypothetical protein KC19_8G010500 [Ceratodon purpureus]
MNHQMAVEGMKSAWDPSRYFATQRGRKVMRTVNAFKVTILCGFITILVLRGTMQAGSGLPDSSKFIDEDAERFQGLTRTSRMLKEAEDETPVDSALVGKFVEEEKWDPSKPYTLGPKISNWDEQRRVWNERNPMQNVTRNGKPKILLVSGSQPGPCGNPMGDFYHLKYLKNRIDYARLHGMEFFYNVATFQKEMNSFWAKLPLLRNLMLNHPETEWIWWMDSDAIFTDMTFEVDLERYVGKNIVIHGFNDLLFEQHKWLGLNTGSFLLRNCQWSLDLLDAWAPYGPSGEVRMNAGKMLTAKLVDRPAFEADDQSALVYLMLFGDPQWRGKLFLEWAFYLHGYWKFVVYNYENVMAKHKPGFGDDRWPFVTHFVGCKPCQYAVTGEVQECFKQMERAFNFADNQVLGKYGYAHRSLATWKTVKVREDTNDPLGLYKAHKNPQDTPTLKSEDLSAQFLKQKEAAGLEKVLPKTTS